MFRTFIFFLFLLCSCNSKKTDKAKLTDFEKSQLHLKYVEHELQRNQEKIFLLSKIKEISYDTIYSILQQYFTSLKDYNNSNERIRLAIQFIAAQNKLSEKKVASIIFSYQYEMVTEDEIIENSYDNLPEPPDN